MNEKSDATMKNITTMLDVLESQLCQAIVWLEAIKAISLAWNQSTVVRSSHFFSGTVYDALWDALIIKTAAIWDKRKGTVSLITLAARFKKDTKARRSCCSSGDESSKDEESCVFSKCVDDFVKSVNGHIKKADESFRAVKSWRDQVIAHRSMQLLDQKDGERKEISEEEFYRLYKINASIITSELNCIEELLWRARVLLGTKPTYLNFLKEDVSKEARMALECWLNGVESVRKDFLASLQPSVNPV